MLLCGLREYTATHPPPAHFALLFPFARSTVGATPKDKSLYEEQRDQTGGNEKDEKK